MQQQADKAEFASGFVPLGSKSEVAPASPLPACDSAGAQAFVARMRGASTADLMALVCRGGYPPRSDIVNQLRNINNPAVLRLLDSGMIDFTPDAQRYYGFVFEQPLNPRYWQTLDETHPPLGEDFINRRFIAPLAEGLRQFADVGLMHGAVRPTNIFWRDNSSGAPQLGDCVTTAPGIGQPLVFESLERAQAQPYARGTGTILDDMYALGVTVLFLILGRHPVKGVDDATILRLRLERGSFSTLVGDSKLPPGHVELLRGLLHDDPRQRWNAYDLEQWAGGQRLSPKQSEFNKRASRGLVFCGKEYWQIRPLIPALWANVPEAMKLIDGGELDRWLRRSMGDEERADRVQDAMTVLKNSGRTAFYDDQMVTMASIALDPNAPIGYRGQVVLPTGVGGGLAEAMRSGGNLQIMAEIISNQFVGFWVNQQVAGKTDLVPLAQAYERMRGFVERTSYGSGLERVVYELNPTQACLSPLLRGQNVITAKDFLGALEKAATQPNRPTEPFDRHIAAWAVTKDRSCDYLLRSVNAASNGLAKALAILNLYAEWQARHGPDRLVAVTGWFVVLLEPLTRRYFNRQTRDAVAAALQQAAASGKLNDLVNLLDNPQMVERDKQSFTAARQVYRATLQQMAVLERHKKYHAEVARTYGRPTATYIAWVLSAIVIIFTIMRALTAG